MLCHRSLGAVLASEARALIGVMVESVVDRSISDRSLVSDASHWVIDSFEDVDRTNELLCLVTVSVYCTQS